MIHVFIFLHKFFDRMCPDYFRGILMGTVLKLSHSSGTDSQRRTSTHLHHVTRSGAPRRRFRMSPRRPKRHASAPRVSLTWRAHCTPSSSPPHGGPHFRSRSFVFASWRACAPRQMQSGSDRRVAFTRSLPLPLTTRPHLAGGVRPPCGPRNLRGASAAAAGAGAG